MQKQQQRTVGHNKEYRAANEQEMIKILFFVASMKPMLFMPCELESECSGVVQKGKSELLKSYIYYTPGLLQYHVHNIMNKYLLKC